MEAKSEGKMVVITGRTTGIGLSLAKFLHAESANPPGRCARVTGSRVDRDSDAGRHDHAIVRSGTMDCLMFRSVAFLFALVALTATRAPGVLSAQATSRDSIGRVRLVVSEQIRSRGRSPVLILEMSTLRQYSCLGYRIEHSLKQRGKALHVELLRVAGPGGLCQQAMGPAILARQLDLVPGRYTLHISDGSKADRFTLDLTDSSTAVVTESASYVEPDTRLRWRFPRRSFALTCGVVPVALPVCEDVQRWLKRQTGISEVVFPPGGLNPYQADLNGVPTHTLNVFSYTRDRPFDAIRRCFAEIEERIRETVAVYLTLMWNDDHLVIRSRKAYHERHVEVPERVTSGPACVGKG